jgi:hypothetical protein
MVHAQCNASAEPVHSQCTAGTQLKKGKKEKKGKNNAGGSEERFAPPTIDEVNQYCAEMGYGVDAERFIAHYEARGWQLKSGKMKSWKGAIKTWELNDKARRREDYIKEHGHTPEAYARRCDEFLAFVEGNLAKGALNVNPA